MTRISFKKVFTKGNLKGLTHDETMPFVNTDAAVKWVEEINKKTSLDYFVTNIIFCV